MQKSERTETDELLSRQECFGSACEESVEASKAEFWCQIPFARLRFRYECLETVYLPQFKGSALRGTFGHALKRVSCALRKETCESCLLRDSCVYAYVFETPPPPDSQRLRLYPNAPHPFILRPPEDTRTQFEAGESLEGELILIGKAIPYLPYFVTSLQLMGELGMGRRRGKLSLISVSEMNGSPSLSKPLYQPATGILKAPQRKAWQEIQRALKEGGDFPSRYTLNLVTPLRLKVDGQLSQGIAFHEIIRNLLRRLSSLAYFHCQIEPGDFDFKGFIREAEKVQTTKSQLRWQEWERYSNRQRQKTPMGGRVGTITFSDVPSQFRSILLVGEQLHVGKMASFGLGQYKIVHSI